MISYKELGLVNTKEMPTNALTSKSNVDLGWWKLVIN